MTIRCERLTSPLSDDDLEMLIEATTTAILDGGAFDWLHPPGNQVLERYFRGLLLVPERSLYVVRENGVIRGAGQLVRPSSISELHSPKISIAGLFVVPYARRRGLGTKLTLTMLDSARALGAKVICCDMRETQTAAINMFHALGFEHWGTHPYYARIKRKAVRGIFFSKLLTEDEKTEYWLDNTITPNCDAMTPGPAKKFSASPLTLYPAIDLKNGACVRLRQGEMGDATQYSDDPAAQAELFAKAGCTHLHVVDLDGAFAGHSANVEAIKSILAATSLPVQLGGGIRNMQTIERWIDAGVARIILGSAAVKDPSLVRQAAHAWPEQIVAGIDARQGRVATEGWAEVSEMNVLDLALRMEDAGVSAVIFTEITRDGMLEGLDLEQTAALARRLSIPVIASGGVGTIEHLRALRQVAQKVPGLSGVIIGRALYDGCFSLQDALAALNEPC